MFELVLLASLVLWILFVNLMSLKNADHPTLLTKALFYAIAPVGIVVDVLYNAILGPIVFMELKFARPGEWTLSQRLTRLAYTDLTWRGDLAEHICRKLIEPWDADHCKLSRLGSLPLY